MHAWAAVAIAQAVLIAASLWRVVRGAGRTVWRPGLVIFVVAALALPVLIADGGYRSAIAVFATIVLASDVLLLQSAVVSSLCTRPAAEEPAVAAPAEPEREDVKEVG